MGKLPVQEGTVSPIAVRHPFPSLSWLQTVSSDHTTWRRGDTGLLEPIREDILEVSGSTQNNMMPFAHKQWVTAVQMVLHIHTLHHGTSLQSTTRCKVQHAEQRENQKCFLCELQVCEEAAVNTWLRAKRLSAVHALMARGCQFPNGLQINYTNEESSERKAVLKNWEQLQTRNWGWLWPELSLSDRGQVCACTSWIPLWASQIFCTSQWPCYETPSFCLNHKQSDFKRVFFLFFVWFS